MVDERIRKDIIVGSQLRQSQLRALRGSRGSRHCGIVWRRKRRSMRLDTRTEIEGLVRKWMRRAQ